MKDKFDKVFFGKDMREFIKYATEGTCPSYVLYRYISPLIEVTDNFAKNPKITQSDYTYVNGWLMFQLNDFLTKNVAVDYLAPLICCLRNLDQMSTFELKFEYPVSSSNDSEIVNVLNTLKNYNPSKKDDPNNDKEVCGRDKLKKQLEAADFESASKMLDTIKTGDLNKEELLISGYIRELMNQKNIKAIIPDTTKKLILNNFENHYKYAYFEDSQDMSTLGNDNNDNNNVDYVS